VSPWWSVVAAAVAGALVVTPRARLPDRGPRLRAQQADEPDWLRRGRWVWCALSGLGAAVFVSGAWSIPAGAVAVAGVWVWIERAEPVAVRRHRQAIDRELPALVQLLAAALESGCDVAHALRVVCAALPGPGAELLGRVPAQLAVGVAPDEAWSSVLEHPALGPLGRTMTRVARSGSSVTTEVARLADELERRAQVRVEERARAVGVKAAVPLGVCLLPSFLLVGIVPLVVGLLRSLSL
jgi:Flp pilus assembly protein TadB